MVVIITTYLTLVVGEIVPKVIALNDPEKVSLKVAKSIMILSKISKPVSYVLAKSSSFLLWLMRIENRNLIKSIVPFLFVLLIIIPRKNYFGRLADLKFTISSDSRNQFVFSAAALVGICSCIRRCHLCNLPVTFVILTINAIA